MTTTMEDRVRRVSTKRGEEDADTFIKKEMGLFLNGYSRCLVQGQENYVEVWVEKDALSRILEDVAYPYCIRTVTCRGYQSMEKIIPGLNILEERAFIFEASGESRRGPGRKPSAAYIVNPKTWGEV